MAKPLFSLVPVAVTLALSSAVVANAQIDRSEINGTVTDASGAVVPGAAVHIVQESTGLTRDVVSGNQGTFVLASLPLGRFTLTVNKAGFSELRISEIDLNSGTVRTLNAHLSVATSTETVSVQANEGSAQLDKDDATFGGTIQSVQVAELPLNGRNISTLELLAPGAIDSGTGQQSSIRFAGQGIDDNNYRFDGVDAAGGLREAVKSALRLQFSTEAVAEFKVDAGVYTADTGGSAGGQVSLISKSGSNHFHGSIFDYLRNSYFDAQSPIKTSQHPRFQLNQFGGNLGGPILKDRTFFFANYEGFRQSLAGVPTNGVVPSPAFRAALLAAQPSLAPWINAYPVSTAVSATNPDQAIYTAVVPSPNAEDSGVLRIDQRFSKKDTGYGRVNVDNGVATSALNAAGQAQTISSTIVNSVIEEQHIFGPRLLNEVELGFNHNTYFQVQKTGLPYNISITGFTGLSEDYNKSQPSTSINGNDTVTFTHGQHTIKFGGEERRVLLQEGNSTDGTLSYTSDANLLAGNLNTIQITAPLTTRYLRKWQTSVYIQDQWKATPDLTLNYGLRYINYTPFTELYNNADPFDVNSCGGYCGIGAQFYFPNNLDFEPRVGLAYSPSQLGGNTVFRAGFGIYHGEIQLGDEDSPAVNTEPSTILTSSATTIYRYPSAAALIPTMGLATTPRSLARHHPYSYTTQWTASIEHSVGSGTTVTATYLGIKGTHLFRRSYTNLLNPATGLRPLPQYPSQIDTKYDEGMSIFHALQINVVHRFHGGLFFGGNYMYSHALDDNSVGAGESNSAENVNNPAADYANSQFDVRHTGNASLVYDLPFGIGRKYMNKSHVLDLIAGGWSLNTLLTARGGLPVDIQLSRSSSQLLDGNNSSQRPNYVTGQPIYAGKGIHSWLNPNAFTVPAAGTWGNLGRDVAVGPTLWQDDAAVEKAFHVTERNAVIFRTESFNIFNRAQYGQPGSTLSTTSCPTTGITPYNKAPCNPGSLVISPPGSFGQILTTVNSGGLVGTGTPRVLEFALRITY